MIGIDIRFDATKAMNMFNRLPEKLEKEVGEGLYNFSKTCQRNLRYQLTLNGNTWDKKHVWNTILAKKMSNNRSVVMMSIKGIYLDRARTHWVSLKPGRDITNWAKKAPNSPFKGMVKLPRAIQVTAHPFINQAMDKSIRNLKPELKRALNRAIKTAKSG